MRVVCADLQSDGDPERDQGFEEKGQQSRETRDCGTIELSEKGDKGPGFTSATETSDDGWSRKQYGGEEQQLGTFWGFANRGEE